ncbi:hypothetical protein [Streptomyces sp. NRRL WC-3742]|uniref:hypothetical protein n=1 Tax=Streptomyces sp. NRRL WC-3742 TaxID=1463934 RepID=UPI00056192D6|nr:hypothetical protein [Streptomyces sp. NRRL WC-3742]
MDHSPYTHAPAPVLYTAEGQPLYATAPLTHPPALHQGATLQPYPAYAYPPVPQPPTLVIPARDPWPARLAAGGIGLGAAGLGIGYAAQALSAAAGSLGGLVAIGAGTYCVAKLRGTGGGGGHGAVNVHVNVTNRNR